MIADVWAAIASWLGVGVALGAAIYTAKQARRASDSLRFAREQAEAAKDQAASARAALELARAERNRADRPRFDIELRPPEDNRCRVVVRMTEGPPGIRVEITWISELTWPGADGAEKRFSGDPVRDELHKNGEVGFDLDVGSRFTDESITKVLVRVIVEATDTADPERTWTDAQVVSWHALPPPQVF